MKYFTTIILLFFCKICLASGFLDACSKYQNDFGIKSRMGTNDCSKIKEKISKLKSFSEVIMSNRTFKPHNRKKLTFSWTEDFPEYYGLDRTIFGNIYQYENNYKTDGDAGRLDLFDFVEYKNLKILPYLPEYFYYNKKNGICEILSRMDQIDTVIIESQLLENNQADNCISKSNLKRVIIRDGFKRFKRVPKTKITGIEYFEGKFEDIKDLIHLEFLGVANSSRALEGIESISNLTKLSHLSLNLTDRVEDLTKLRLLKNLIYLNLSCVMEEKTNSLNIKSCEKKNVIDVSFLTELRWLKHLNITSYAVTQIESLKNLKYLTYLKLKDSNLSHFSFPLLSRIEYLDLSFNNLEQFAFEKDPTTLRFLNLSDNKLNSSLRLGNPTNLKYLNLSGNDLLKWHQEEAIPSLRVLNLNGESYNEAADNFENGINTNTYKGYESEQQLLIETVYNAKINSKKYFELQGCSSKTTIDSSFDFSKFPNVEILSITHNKLASIPTINNLKKLNYFKIDYNSINNFSSLPESITLLSASYNNLSNLPSLEGYKDLKYMDFSNNQMEEIYNISDIRHPISELILTDNLITNLTPMKNITLDEPENYSTSVELFNNPISRDEQNCPLTGNDTLISNCKKYISGDSSSLDPSKGWTIASSMIKTSCSRSEIIY